MTLIHRFVAIIECTVTPLYIENMISLQEVLHRFCLCKIYIEVAYGVRTYVCLQSILMFGLDYWVQINPVLLIFQFLVTCSLCISHMMVCRQKLCLHRINKTVMDVFTFTVRRLHTPSLS